MRPVRLEMTGFASFRAETIVDFEGADYFALTGPTGSGKSTVIDAMTFALYGSAPRWGRANSVQYALAPTTNRATVRLVFDAGGQRYRVAREIRRSGQSISQKTATLERLDDPTTLEATTDEVQVLASEVREVTPAVEELLGLSFDDFTKAVVLPQGRFAEFLGATVGERQEILLKLLGAHQYDIVMRAAGERRKTADAEVTAAEARIDELGGATHEAEDEAAAERDALADLGRRTHDLRNALEAARQAATGAGAAVATASGNLERISTIRIPDGITDLAARAGSVRQEVDRRRQVADAAEAIYRQAHADLEAGGNRSRLERLAEAWSELTSLADALPALREAAESADSAADSAAIAREESEQAWSLAVKAEAEAVKDAESAAAHLDGLVSRRAAIAAVVPPEGLADLAARLEAATTAVGEASERRDAAERAEDAARSDQAQAGDPFDIATLIERYDAATALTTRIADLTDRVAAATAAHTEAGLAADRAAAHLTAARQRVADEQVHTAAAGLRSRLSVGQPCPVCTTTVATLPEPFDSGDASEAADAVRLAEAAMRSADAAVTRAEGEVSHLTSSLTESTNRLAELIPDPDDLDRLRSEASERLAASRAATSRLNEAGLQRRAAAGELSEARRAEAALDAERRAGFAALREQRARLLPLGAPVAEAETLHEAWAELLAWAGQAHAELEAGAIPPAEAAAAEARAQLIAAREALEDAVRARRQASTTADEARTALLGARSALDTAGARIAALTTQLEGAPGAAEVASALDALTILERRAREAFNAYKQAASDRDQAIQRENDLSEELAAASTLLRETREPLIPLGAPSVDTSDLPAAWAALTAWAADSVSAAEADLASARRRAADAQAAAAAAGTELLDAAVAGGVQAPTAADVPAAVAARLALAEERLTAIRSSLNRLATLHSERDDAFARRQVAAMLAEQLSAKKFQRWLAGAALDVLVEAASSSLVELSGGQFSLTHEKGEFYVIDHADAEAMRSVRTLSGGETFQASLALALALSAELSSMSSQAARLDSIFLDEGFGSLDPESLEVVATTLERLAQGDRLVGVVTHVAALAERIPTRFAVTRTSRTSTITRVG